MLKNKQIWLCLSMLILCCGVMSFGVYAALSATINMSGTLGFNMHNATVAVAGKIYNLAETNQSTNVVSKVDRSIATTIMGGESTTKVNLNIGDMNFYYGAYTDSETGTTTSKVYDIVFQLTFTNVSEVAILATIPLPTVESGVTIVHGTTNSDYTDLLDYSSIITQGESVVIRFALSLSDASNLLNNVNFSWQNITFEETVVEIPDTYEDEQGLMFTLNESKTGWSVKGGYLVEVEPDGPVAPGESAYSYVCNLKTTEIVIPEKIFGVPVVEIESNSFGTMADMSSTAINVNITKVTLPSTIITIGEAAFARCFTLLNINIPEGVSTIADSAFRLCKGLTGNIIVPNSVVSIGSSAFRGCTDIVSVEIGSGVAEIKDYVFAACSKLTSVTFKNVTPPTFGIGVFDSSTALTNIYVPNATAVINYKAVIALTDYADYVKTK